MSGINSISGVNRVSGVGAVTAAFRSIPGRTRRVRLSALLLCILFCLASSLSAGYLFTHVGHVHDHEAPEGGCATCANLQVAANLLKTFTAAVAWAAVFKGVVLAFPPLWKPGRSRFLADTPVKRKVRMDN
ncbi:MAG: hypothetical protein LBQ15_01430 [Clostridium sp.]|nr:hypothetical protein [Clostridium sp.]